MQPKILLQQPNVLLIELNILLIEVNILLLQQNIFVIPILTNDFVGITKPFIPCLGWCKDLLRSNALLSSNKKF